MTTHSSLYLTEKAACVKGRTALQPGVDTEDDIHRKINHT